MLQGTHTESWKQHYEHVRRGVDGLNKLVQQAGSLRETLASGQELLVRVTDHTLEPCIERGDAMIFMVARYEKINVGDFVMYKLNDGTAAVRRVVRKMLADGYPSFVTRSDVDPRQQDLVPAVKIMARLFFVERHGKRIPAHKLNKGLFHRLSEYGNLTPAQTVMKTLLFGVPVFRPHYELPANINRVDVPQHTRERRNKE